MRPTSSQPARRFATTDAHKFTDTKQININDLIIMKNMYLTTWIFYSPVFL